MSFLNHSGFLILIWGNNSIDKITNMNVDTEIIIVGIITKAKLCSYCLIKTTTNYNKCNPYYNSGIHETFY